MDADKYFTFSRWIDDLEVDINERVKTDFELPSVCDHCHESFDGVKGIRSRFEEDVDLCGDACADAWDTIYLRENLEDVFNNLEHADEALGGRAIYDQVNSWEEV